MLKRYFGERVHDVLQFTGLCILAAGISSNKVLMSIGTIWLISNLVLEGSFRTYVTNIRGNRPVQWLLIFCLVHVAALTYTSDMAEAAHDFRVKLPLLVIPLSLAAKPLISRRKTDILMCVFVASLVVTSTINYLMYAGLIGNRNFDDIRGMSLFGSHIRYGILVSLGAAVCVYLAIRRTLHPLLFIAAAIWLTFYTFYSEIISGFASLLACLLTILFIVAYRRHRWISWGLTALVIAGAVFLVSFLWPPKKVHYELSDLPEKTVNGNPYKHDLRLVAYEDGQPIFVMISDQELDREWAKVSHLSLDSTDGKGQRLRGTLIRYMASKGLTKDSLGFQGLTTDDIRHIENGVPSVKYLRPGILGRLETIRYQLDNNTNPNGHSLLQRIAYWKAALGIISEHPLAGVGTGDIKLAFADYYERTHSKLEPENRHHSHNMFLTVWVTFGIPGLLSFLLMLFVFLRYNFRHRELVGVLFAAAFICSFFMEDTLETQMGVTAFAFFFGLFSTPKEPGMNGFFSGTQRNAD